MVSVEDYSGVLYLQNNIGYSPDSTSFLTVYTGSQEIIGDFTLFDTWNLTGVDPLFADPTGISAGSPGTGYYLDLQLTGASPATGIGGSVPVVNDYLGNIRRTPSLATADVGAYELQADTAPVITSIDSDDEVDDKQTSVEIVGTDFEAVQGTGTVEISDDATYGDGNVVAQTVTSWSDTSIDITVVLGAMYFLVISPLAIVMKVSGRDALKLKHMVENVYS